MYITTGQKFFFYTAVEDIPRAKMKARFRCDCGTEKSVLAGSVKCGQTKSCGCIMGKHKVTHGKTNTKAFKTWWSMRQRCENPNNASYANYGGRGIAVDQKWATFEVFYEDMGDPPGREYQLDRIDNDKGYGPENCRWVTCKQNNNNRRSNRPVTAWGETKTISEWLDDPRAAIKNKQTLRDRLEAGWDSETAITKPSRRRQIS